MENSTRKLHLDMLRIISIMLVLFNHTEGYYLFSETTGAKQIVYMFITMCTKVAVPLLFMISGALLLDKEETYKDIFHKRIKKYSIVIIFFSIVMYISIGVKNSNFKDLFSSNTFLEILSGNQPNLNSYWFLYSYIGYLLLLPFLSVIAKNINKIHFAVLLGVKLLFSIRTQANILLMCYGLTKIQLSDSFVNALDVVTNIVLWYPIVGYYIEKKFEVTRQRKKTICGIVIIGFVAIILESYNCYLEYGLTGKYSQNWTQQFDYIIAICVYSFIKWICVKNERSLSNKKKYIAIFSGVSFGVYLLDPIIKIFFYGKIWGLISIYFPTIIASLIWVIFSCIVGGTVTYILKHTIAKRIL